MAREYEVVGFVGRNQAPMSICLMGSADRTSGAQARNLLFGQAKFLR